MAVAVATNFSAVSRDAVVLGAELARTFGTTLELVHVASPGSDSDDARNRLAGEASALADDVTVTTKLIQGELGDALATYVVENGVSLLVVGGVRRSTDAHLGEDLAKRLSCPVLVATQETSRLRYVLRDHQRLRIFAAIDNTRTADAAVAWLHEIRTKVPCDIFACYTYWPPTEHARLGVPLRGDWLLADQRVTSTLENELLDRFSGLQGNGELVVSCVPNLGSVADNLVQSAERCDAHLVVIGSHHRIGVERVVHGSVSHRVLRLSRAPVLCISSPADAMAHPKQLRHVLVVTDLSPLGNDAVAYACQLVHDSGQVDIMHVLSEIEGTKIATARHALEEVAQAVPAGTTATCVLENGADVAATILQRAERTGVDAIVLSKTARGSVSRTLLGSVSASVVRDAQRPVFIVPPREA